MYLNFENCFNNLLNALVCACTCFKSRDFKSVLIEASLRSSLVFILLASLRSIFFSLNDNLGLL